MFRHSVYFVGLKLLGSVFKECQGSIGNEVLKSIVAKYNAKEFLSKRKERITSVTQTDHKRDPDGGGGEGADDHHRANGVDGERHCGAAMDRRGEGDWVAPDFKHSKSS